MCMNTGAQRDQYACIKRSVHIHVFSTLYSSIPHNSLKVNVLRIFIDEAFRISGVKYLCIDKLGSAYCVRAQSGCAKLNMTIF